MNTCDGMKAIGRTQQPVSRLIEVSRPLLPRLEAFTRVVEAARPLGAQQLADGAQLIGKVPHIGPEAWLHVLFPPLQEPELQTVTTLVGRAVPAAAAELLQTFNGLSIFSGALVLYGLRRQNTRDPAVRQPFSIATPNTLERPPGVDSLFFLGGYGQDASQLALDANGKVIRLAPRATSVLNSWASLPDLLNSEAVRLSRLFDESGKKISAAAWIPPDLTQ